MTRKGLYVSTRNDKVMEYSGTYETSLEAAQRQLFHVMFVQVMRGCLCL